MSKTVRTSSISPPPGQQDQSARLAASAEVGQVEGTNSLELFQRWLETAAHDALRAYENPPADLSGQDLRLHLEGCEIALLDCRAATQLLMAFKVEQSQ